MTAAQIVLRIVASLVWLAAAALAAFMAMFSPMLFDAPSSTERTILWVLMGALVLAPVTCLAAAALPWILRGRSGWAAMAALPILHAGAIATIMVFV